MENSIHPIEEIKKELSLACEGKIEPAAVPLQKAPPAASGFDLASPLGFQMARDDKSRSPFVHAQEITERLSRGRSFWIEKAEPRAPGFVNLRLSLGALERIASKPLEEGGTYPQGVPWSAYGVPGSVLLEYCSANPTGPMHFGHARGAVLGDTLARLYRHVGVRVHREYYINDVGGQVEKLGASLEARYRQEMMGDLNAPFPEDGYPGQYLKEIARRLPPDARTWNRAQFAQFAKAAILDLIKGELSLLGIAFDTFYPESSLHEAGAVRDAVAELEKRGFTVEQEGALFFRAQGLSEEDKERVLRRANGQPTYFASDIAYHRDKLARGFERLINIWGADHHGYVPRVKRALEALGLDASRLEVVLIQMVRLMRQGKAVTLSKRAGDYTTLGEIVQEVGTDALRFFLNNRSPDTQLDFDLDLAKKRSSDNPVYFIQYAHARIASIHREKASRAVSWPQEREKPAAWLEKDEASRALALHLALFSETILDCLTHHSAHPMNNYLLELARQFHRYYENHPVLTEADSRLAWGRWQLCQSISCVLALGLAFLGVSAPEKM